MITEKIVKQVPKVELHYHLDGGVRPQTLIDLAKKDKFSLPENDPDKLAAWFHRGADRKSLALYLEGFSVTCGVMQKAENIKRIAKESLIDLAADGVVYAEIRFAPILHQEQGLNLEMVVQSVLDGLEEGKKETGIEYGVILCAMRHQPADISLEIAELAVSFRRNGVVGFDIAGDESGHPPKHHLDAFQYIRRKNFPITIHAGEAFGVESIWQAVQICGAQRIGHATRLTEDMHICGTHIEKMGTLSHFIRDRRIPLEICLSSNVQTGATDSLDTHPFPIFYRNRFRVFLATDNPLMSNTTLTKEMMLAVEYYSLELGDLEKLTLNAMKSAFISYNDRLRIIYDVIKPGYNELRKTVSMD